MTTRKLLLIALLLAAPAFAQIVEVPRDAASGALYIGTTLPAHCQPNVSPAKPLTVDAFLLSGTGSVYTCVDGVWTLRLSASGGGTWGSITGTLTNQTDLSNALNLKAPLIGPSFTNPNINNAVATTINKVTITAPASGATLTIVNGKTLTVSNDATVSGTNTGDQTNVSGTAGALAANGTNCSAGNAPTGVDAAGNAENCTVLAITKASVTSNALISYNSATGLFTAAQFNFTDLLGSLAHAQLPTLLSGDIPNNAANTSGTAATSTILATARTINGDSFDGSANIQNTLASADFANQGTTSTLLHGAAAGNPSWTSVVNADIASATIDLTAKVTGTLPVTNGGSGAATLTANNVILGSGTSAVQFVAPGTNGNTLTSNGTTWVSATPSGGSPPFTDDATQGLVKGSIDATKLLGFNVAGMTTGNHAVVTIGGTTAAPTWAWLGTMSTALFTRDERFGKSAFVNGNDETALGASTSVTSAGGTAVGSQASSDNGVAVGASASGQTEGTAVGHLSSANGGTALGSNTSAPGFGAIALGRAATAGAAHVMVVGGSIGSNGSITDAWFGSGRNDTSPVALTFHTTAGSGTNNAGSDMIFAPGAGTGSATGGNDRVQTAPPGASGSSNNASIDRFVIKAAPVSLTSGVAAVVDDIQLPTLAMTGGKIVWTIICTDGTDIQSVSGEIVFSAVNKGGVYNLDIETVSSATPSDTITPVIGWAKALSSGTLTTAWTIVSGTNKVQVKVTSTTSLTATAFKLYTTIINNSEQALN